MDNLTFEKIVNLHSFKSNDLLFNSNSLCGECGEVANIIKKIEFVKCNPNWIGDGLPTIDELEVMLNDELSDVLFYIARLAKDNGCDLSQLMVIQSNKINNQTIKYKRTYLK